MVIGKILGHNCLSLNAIINNRINKEFTKNGPAAMEQLIKQTLQIITDHL